MRRFDSMPLDTALKRMRRGNIGYCVCGAKTGRVMRVGNRYRYAHQECEEAVKQHALKSQRPGGR